MTSQATYDALSGLIGENSERQDVNMWLDTGVAELNEAISGSVDLGMPVGRLIEIFGPPSCGKTFLSTMVMAACQQAGGIAGFSDHERSFKADLAQSLGLNVDASKGNWFYQRPQTFEESVDKAVAFCEAVRRKSLIPEEAPLVWVFDSVASMIPHEKLYDAKGNRRGVGDYNMRDSLLLAKCTSQSYPMLAQFAEDNNMLVLLLNQIRMKPGVMFGDPTCLHGDVKVPFVDGTYATMREIVEGRIEKEVWSFNESTGSFEAKPITGWHDNGEISDISDWIHVETAALHTKNGRAGLTMTPDHKVLTPGCNWVPASSLSVGDKMISRRISRLNGSFETFLRAAMSGDAHVLSSDKPRNGAVLRIQDNNDPEYMRWKVGKLSKYLSFSRGTARIKGKEYEYWSSTRGDEDVAMVNQELRGNRCPLQALKELDPMMLAIWIMDDAFYDEAHKRYTLSIKRFARSPDLTRIADRLFDLGLDFGVRRGEGSLMFTVESSRKLAEMICTYVPPCMDRKLPADLRGRYVEFELQAEERALVEEVEIIEIRSLGEKAAQRNRSRYDITVADNHNYMVGSRHNGVIVHNCTPGGNAAEFYCSSRISLGKKEINNGKSGAEKKILGNKVKAKLVKNKISRPFETAEWRVLFQGHGAMVDEAGTVLDYLDRKGLINKSGNGRFDIGGKNYTFNQVVAACAAEPKLLDKLKAMAREEDAE